MASLPRTSGRLYPGHQGIFTQDIPCFGLWQPLSLHPKYPRDITLFQFVLCHIISIPSKQKRAFLRFDTLVIEGKAHTFDPATQKLVPRQGQP
ncbi:hypothetical protein ACOMHN_057934 [Nucella lapillus]